MHDPFLKWIEPMRATLTDARFSSPEWIFERKWDGFRALAFCNKRVNLLSRNQLSFNEDFPEIVASLESQVTVPMILDGELVAYQGRTGTFSNMQQRTLLKNKKTKILYHVFDLLYYKNKNIMREPLIARKQLLKESIPFSGPIRYSSHYKTHGERYFTKACNVGWEGLIAKRSMSPYVPYRSSDWLKFKCEVSQEFVIGGYSDPQGSREGIGALLVGYYAADGLHYAGKVGTGYSFALLKELAQLLAPLEQQNAPFIDLVRASKGIHWVRPKLVCQVHFSEWTHEGKLRHPRFQGLRPDKDARNVIKET